MGEGNEDGKLGAIGAFGDFWDALVGRGGLGVWLGRFLRSIALRQIGGVEKCFAGRIIH